MYKKNERHDIIKAICDDVVLNGISFNEAVKNSPITNVSFYSWIAENEELQNLYNYARKVRSDILFEEIIEIADTIEEGEVIKESDKGTIIERGDMTRHRQLKIDARKWVVAKMQPKKYGDKLDITSDGEKIEPQQIPLTADQITKAIDNL